MTLRHLSTRQRLYKSEKFIKEHGLLFDNMNDTAKNFSKLDKSTKSSSSWKEILS